jgi:flagellar hook-associated protein 2
MATEGIASKIINTLGNGSGIDFTQLARDLADVEKAPREARITTATEAAEAKISAFAVLKYNVQLLIDQFKSLNDASELATPKATSSDTTVVSVVSTDGSANSGLAELHVDAVALSQRNKSDVYTSTTQSINGGSAFNITVQIPESTGTISTIAVGAGDDNPIGVVAAINSAGLGITATLMTLGTDGNEYQIMLEGQTGAANSFEIDTDLPGNDDLGFHTGNENTSGTPPMDFQQAADADFYYNGVQMQRASNTLSDVIPGVTISLNALSAGADTTTISVVSDQSTLKTKLESLVATYNDMQFALDEISDSESENEEVGGALARDLSAIRTVRDAVYTAVTQTSSTPSGNVTGMRDIGVTLTRDGNLQFDEATYDGVAATNFNDISIMISAGTTNQSRYDGQSQGLAMDAIIELEVLTDSIDGIFVTRTATAQKQITAYEKDLADLEVRIEQIYQRYLDQFIAMETLVSSINSTRESMTTTWENMSKMYNK